MQKKPIKKIKCRTCKKSFVRINSLHVVCSTKCAIDYAKKQTQKKQAEIAKKEKRRLNSKKESIKTRSQLAQEAQKAVNQYIRIRDARKPCISCLRHHDGQYHAGHYLSVGARPELRFNLLNIHKQCAPCNNHLSGNLVNYRINLIEKIGLDKVECLESAHTAKNYTHDDLRRIKNIFNKKAKRLKKVFTT